MNLSLNQVRDIKPNDIKFKNIHIERLPKHIRSTITRLQSLKELGLGHISYGKSLRSLNKDKKKAINTVKQFENNLGISRNQFRNHEHSPKIAERLTELQKRRSILNGPVATLSELQKRRSNLNGPVATLSELQKRRSNLNGPVATLSELQKRRRNLNN
jgi:hypothetical protein